MTPDEIRSHGPTVDVVVAASYYGAGRSLAYDLVRREQFPVPVLRLGRRYRVRTEDIVRDLFGPAHAQEAAHSEPP